MFIKLHHRDVLALLALLEDVELETDEERHAYDKLVLMRTAMESALKRQLETERKVSS